MGTIDESNKILIYNTDEQKTWSVFKRMILSTYHDHYNKYINIFLLN